MKYCGTLIAISNLEKSKKFYQELFDMKVVLDLGWNVVFNGGFSIQLNFDQIANFPKEQIIQKPNNMELYFEVDDFDAFLENLRTYPDIEYFSEPTLYEWQQRGVRIYDPDYHIIEIAESMEVIARRHLAEGHSVEETANFIQHPIEFVQQFV